MRTTVDLPADLFRKAKAGAASRGESLKTLLTRAVAVEVGQARHQHHGAAKEWLDEEEDDLAFCRVTQMALLRLVANPAITKRDVLSRRSRRRARVTRGIGAVHRTQNP